MFPRALTLLALTVSLSLAAPAAATPAAATAPAGFVQIRGPEFVTSDGAVLHLRGTNFGNWMLPEGYMWGFNSAASPRLIEDVIAQLVGDVSAAEFWKQWHENYITRADVHYLKAAGFNTVRIPLTWRLFVTEQAPFRLEGPGWALLEQVVGWCRAEGLYVVLDLHAAPGGQTGANIDDSRARPLLFEDPAAKQLTLELWRELARRYGNDPWVLGYDLLNEPVADYNNPARYNPMLAAFYRELVSAIRQIDPHHIIFLGGAQWDMHFDEIGMPFAPNLAYTFHLYHDEPVKASLQRYLDWRDKTNAPLWLGESGEDPDPWMLKFRLLVEAEHIDWCFWTYKKIGADRCVATAAAPADWPAIVKFAESPRGTDFGAIRAAVPSLELSRRALAELLDNVRFEKCRINPGYVRALGLNPAPEAPAKP